MTMKIVITMNGHLPGANHDASFRSSWTTFLEVSKSPVHWYHHGQIPLDLTTLPMQIPQVSTADSQRTMTMWWCDTPIAGVLSFSSSTTTTIAFLKDHHPTAALQVLLAWELLIVQTIPLTLQQSRKALFHPFLTILYHLPTLHLCQHSTTTLMTSHSPLCHPITMPFCIGWDCGSMPQQEVPDNSKLGIEFSTLFDPIPFWHTNSFHHHPLHFLWHRIRV